MDQNESRNAPSPGGESDDFAPPVNSQPAGAPDRLAFEPVPLRHRVDGLTPEKQRAYVEALADTGIAREAAARVGLTEQAINRVRRRADARSFDDACEAAHLFGARRLRSIAYERAVEGTLKGHYYHGERVGEERVHDNRLLIYLLGKTEHLLARNERKSRAICENWEDHMDALEQGLPPPQTATATAAAPDGAEWTGLEVRQDEEGIWWTSFPPPAGFDGEELGRFGEDDYERTLSAREQAELDAELDEEAAESRASESARRDRYFGFAGDGIPSSREAEPYETSEPSREEDPEEGPLEYKSAFPVPAAGLAPPAGRAQAETGRRRGASSSIPACAPCPAPAGSNFRPASPKDRWRPGSLRASAPPRGPDCDLPGALGCGRPALRTFPPPGAIPR